MIDSTERSRTMPVNIPQALRTMLEDKAYGHVVTFNAQGKPELTMVWMDLEGDELLFNTSEGRRKPDNIRRDPRVIVSVQDRNNPQAYAVFCSRLSPVSRWMLCVSRIDRGVIETRTDFRSLTVT